MEAGQPPVIVHVNPAFLTLTGHAREEVIGGTPRVLMGPESDRAAITRLIEELRAGRPVAMQTPKYRRDGVMFMMRMNVFPMRDSGGALTHFMAILGDADHDRATEVAGQVSRAVLRQTTEALLVIDARGRVTYANPAALTLLGRTAPQVDGLPIRATGLTPRRLRTYRDIVAALERQPDWRGEYESSARTGESRRLAVSITRLDTTDPRTRFVADVRDLTHQRRLEYIAEATNFVENVGYVFASLRHELANPVNSIKTALTVLRSGLASMHRERVEGYLDRVLNETTRVEYLLSSMRSFNSMNHVTLAPMAVGPFLERFSAMVNKDVARRRVPLVVRAHERAEWVVTDRQALHQVLLNLLTNALDAVHEVPDAIIRIEAWRGASHLRVTVSDNGPGVPNEHREKIFQPFHTGKTNGTGLGLAITRKLVTLMRGTIELDPGSGSGATFTVTLDAADTIECHPEP